MLAPNTTLQGRYRVVRQLGRGGMGTVYEAKALRLNTTVALKETHFEDERLRRQFEREAQLLANLRHPALPRVIDHFDESDGLYLVMDFVEGEDLWEMLKKRGEAFPAADVIKWAGQLLDALEYLHTQQPPVIHRDIKPQNLKLNEDGRLILLDFGLAKGMSGDAQSLLSSRTVMGFSLPYAPLEQILQLDESSREQLSVLNSQEVERVRRSGTDRRSDLYSAGATLLHLLTAKVPVTSPTRAISLWSDRADPLEDALAHGVPESLRPFIRRSMTLDPEQRFGSAEEMRDALRDATEDSEENTFLAPTVLSAPSESTPPQAKADASEGAAVESQGHLTETQRLQLEYWTAFKNFLQERGSFLSAPKPFPQHWMPFAIGRSNFRLSAFINTMERRPKLIAVDLAMGGPDAKPHFHLLHREREEIEDEAGESLEWAEKPENKESYIRLKRYKLDPTDRGDWPSQHAWLQEKLELFHKVFAPRIRTLRAADYRPGAVGEASQELAAPAGTTQPTTHESSTRPAPSAEVSRRDGKSRGRFVAAGVIVAALLIAAVAATVYLSSDGASVANTNANTNSAAPQTPTPAPQPSVTPTAEGGVTPTPEASQQPVGNPINANRRAAPVTTPTPAPTPRTVTPQPPPQATPQPPDVDDAPDDAGADERAGARDIDERIRRLEDRRAALLVNFPPGSREVRMIDRRISNLKQRRRALRRRGQ